MSKICTLCGSPIPEERLEIVPNTTLCTACKMGEEPRRNVNEVYNEFPSLEDFLKDYKVKTAAKKKEQDAVKMELILKKLKTAKQNRPPECPICGKPMVVRVLQRDSYPFYGCKGYPNCSFTLNK